MPTKALILAAGRATRMHPVTRALPKEMLPLGRRPALEYVVDELTEAGCDDILFLVREGKELIAQHFGEGTRLARFAYRNQHEPWGTGGAVLQVREWAGQENFFVAYGDSVISMPNGSRGELCKRLSEHHEAQNASASIGLWQVVPDQVSHYGIVESTAHLGAGAHRLSGLIEKPTPANAPGNLALAARFVLSPDIWSALEACTVSSSGELLLTDALVCLMSAQRPVVGVELTPNETRYDIGGFAQYYKAFMDFALLDAEHAAHLRQSMLDRLTR